MSETTYKIYPPERGEGLDEPIAPELQLQLDNERTILSLGQLAVNYEAPTDEEQGVDYLVLSAMADEFLAPRPTDFLSLDALYSELFRQSTALSVRPKPVDESKREQIRRTLGGFSRLGKEWGITILETGISNNQKSGYKLNPDVKIIDNRVNEAPQTVDRSKVGKLKLGKVPRIEGRVI